MPIRDHAIGWKLKRLYIPIRVMQGLDNNGTNTQSLNEGTSPLAVITTMEVVGMVMTTADELAHVMGIPWDMDRDAVVRGRIYFQHNATAADAPIFKWLTKFYAKQAALTEFFAAPDVTTTFAAHTCSTTAASLEVTNWNDLSWDDYIVSEDVFVAFGVELDDLGGSSADECVLLGVEIEYQVKATDEYRHKSVAEAANTV